MRKSIAIIDLGGQYCHLISRRLKDCGIPATIHSADVRASRLKGSVGLILSGGPNSVYDPDSPRIRPELMDLDVPVLGICYGHQLLVQMLGGHVEKADGEYGPSNLFLAEADTIFSGLPERQVVWMSHTDSVTSLPPGALRLAGTERCLNSAFAMPKRRIFGVQFHPEVFHTEHGTLILRNFGTNICGMPKVSRSDDSVGALTKSIRKRVGKRSVFFFVSGGVDSTVAYALCAKALPQDRVFGLYVDTGLMRRGEAEELRENLHSVGLDGRLVVRDESERFLSALSEVTEPEEKRRIIGRLFVKVQSDAMEEYGIDPRRWLLGQGTIYPDTIESGGSKGRAAVIKTHHNRCDEIRDLIEQGLVLEPLSDFYKDEVRRIGADLKLGPKLTERWPFPGPGLAIRCLCSAIDHPKKGEHIPLPPGFREEGYEGLTFPISSVGVQGDARTYRDIAVISGGPRDYKRLRELSTSICNISSGYNRVVFFLGEKDGKLSEARVIPTRMDRHRIETLRDADAIVCDVLEEMKLTNSVWQFPVVLLPIQLESAEGIVLRPVESTDGMTAKFAGLSWDCLEEMKKRLLALPGVDGVYLDITDKPPATIEWE